MIHGGFEKPVVLLKIKAEAALNRSLFANRKNFNVATTKILGKRTVFQSPHMRN